MRRNYEKLVRDNIIEIIEKDGKTCTYKILDNDQYIKYLHLKLNEEVNEYNVSFDIEELADIQEVIDAIIKARGLTQEEFSNIKNAKAKKNGKFENKILLIDVEEE